LRLVLLPFQFPSDCFEIPFDSSVALLYVLKGLAIYSRRSLVRSDKIIGMGQDIQPVDLVI
jgi:hypothetical protein